MLRAGTVSKHRELNKVQLTDIGPVKILEFTPLSHETIRTPEIEKEILFDWFIKYVLDNRGYFPKVL